MSVRPLGIHEARRAPGLYDRLELLLFVVVLGFAIATPALDAAGQPNAPFKTSIASTTGGGLCVFKRWSGYDCGGCGMTRAFVQLGHGRVLPAVLLNPMAPIAFLWVLARALQLLVHNVTGRDLEYGFPNRWKWRFYAFCLLAFIALSATRFGCGALGVPQLL